MKEKIISCQVRREQFLGAGGVVGAAGSGNDAALRLRFSAEWEPLVKYVTFRDARGESPVVVLLTADMLVPPGPEEGEDGPQAVYHVPIPAQAKAVEGKLTVTVQGYELSPDGSQVEAAAVTAAACFRVLPSGYAIPEDGSITPTLSQQLQREIETIKGDVLTAAGAAEAERLRGLAEEARAAAEAARGLAELERVEAEGLRALAERAREAAEADRRAAELARVDGTAGVVALAREQAAAAQAARGDAQTAAERAERAAEQAAAMTGGPFAPLDEEGQVPDGNIGDNIPRLRAIASRQRDLSKPDYGLGGIDPDAVVSSISQAAYEKYSGIGDEDIEGELAENLDRLKLKKTDGSFYAAADAAEVDALMMAAVIAAEATYEDNPGILNDAQDSIELTWMEFQYYVLTNAITDEESGNIPTYTWKPGADLEWDAVLEGRDAAGNRALVLPVTRLGLIEADAEVKAAPAGTDYLPLVDTAGGSQMKKVTVEALAAAVKSGLRAQGFAAGTAAPEDTGLLWIDTGAGGVLKYHDAASNTWKAVKAVWG